MPAFRTIQGSCTLDGTFRQQSIFAMHPSPDSRPLPSPFTVDTFERACGTRHQLDPTRLVEVVSSDPAEQERTERALFDALHAAGEFDLLAHEGLVAVYSAVKKAYAGALNPGPGFQEWVGTAPYAPVSTEVWRERATHEGRVVELWFGARRIERLVETYGNMGGAQFFPLGDDWPLVAARHEAIAWKMAGRPLYLAGACLLSFELQYWMLNHGAWTARFPEQPFTMPLATIVEALQEYLLVPSETAVSQHELEFRTYLMEVGADLLCLVTGELAVARAWYEKTLTQTRVLGMIPGNSTASQVVRLGKKIACL